MSKWLCLLALVAVAGCRDEGKKQADATRAAPLEEVGAAPQAEQGRAAAEAARAREACVDAWLEAHDLNEFGDPPDTVYIGGTPLFDERTGKRADRLEHVLARHAELREICR